MNHVHKLLLHKLQCLRHNDHIRIVPHITGGCAKMDNAGGPWALSAIGIDMAHNIMPHLFFPGLRHIIIDIILMGL